MRDNGENLGCQTSARLDRLAVDAYAPAEGSGALGRHQRRSIVSGTDMKPNAEITGAARLFAQVRWNAGLGGW